MFKNSHKQEQKSWKNLCHKKSKKNIKVEKAQVVAITSLQIKHFFN